MGLVSPDAAARWLAAGARPFEGLTVAMAPFTSANRVERDMLTTVLKSGGASVASISAKGEVVPSSPKPDVAVVDPGSMAGSEGKPSVSGRAAAAAARWREARASPPSFSRAGCPARGQTCPSTCCAGSSRESSPKRAVVLRSLPALHPAQNAREEENGGGER